MSDSTDNTTELDSYGVWVKRPGSTEDTSSDSLDIDAAFDIPDFAEDEITIDETPAEEIEMPEVSSDDIDLSSFDIPVEEDIPGDEILPEETEISEESDSFIDGSEIKIEEKSEESEESMDDISNEISFGDFDNTYFLISSSGFDITPAHFGQPFPYKWSFGSCLYSPCIGHVIVTLPFSSRFLVSTLSYKYFPS